MKKEREILIELIKEYYQSIGRKNTPPYQDYSLQELKGCCHIFKIPFENKMSV
jgi:hypothetical protein